MENKENISRRDALKRMSKAALAVAVVSIFPSVNAQANESNSNSQYYCDSSYKDVTNYRNYYNYDNYKNYNDYKNYNNYQDCN